MHEQAKIKADFNNMLVFAFSGTILLVGQWTRNMMFYSYEFKKGIKRLVFSTPISLDIMNFSTKLSFYKVLEIMKELKNSRFMAQEINPCKFTEIINKAHIIIVLTN